MPDPGFRSIQILVSNDTQQDLAISGVTIGPGAQWMAGQAPVQGDLLLQFAAAQWGVLTDDVNSSASCQLMITMPGNNYPLEIAAMNDENNNSVVHIIPNNKMVATVTEQDTGEVNHSQYMIQLLPLR